VVKSTVEATTIPVTVKIRTGPSEDLINAREIAQAVYGR